MMIVMDDDDSDCIIINATIYVIYQRWMDGWMDLSGIPGSICNFWFSAIRDVER